MSDNINADEQSVANAFGNDIDPLAKHDVTFRELDADPFDMWMENRVLVKGLAKGTITNYERDIRQWEEYMELQDRHPACPSEAHVKGFAAWCFEQDNGGETISKKLMTIGMAFRYFQSKQAFPHPNTFDPFSAARSELDLSDEDAKEPPNISEEELAEKFGEVKNIRDRVIMGLQLKLGLRSSEVCNIKLSEIHVGKSELLKHYDDMGTSPLLEGEENAVYIPFDRERNKSRRPRVLPLDDEMRMLLLDYMLVRQDNGSEWLLLSMRGNQLDRDALLHIWKKHWHPEFEGDDRYRPVTPHFGRHFFTTWFKKEEQWPMELVQYMRGDKHGGGAVGRRNNVIHEYVHTYFSDVKEAYDKDVFKFGLYKG